MEENVPNRGVSHVVMCTYGDDGRMLQCSGVFDSVASQGVVREDFIGTRARDWGAEGIVAQSLFSDCHEIVTRAVTPPTPNGVACVTAVGMRLHRSAKAVVIGFEPYTHRLTGTEISVIGHLADGLSQAEVAKQSRRSVESVKSSIASVKRKFGARTTVQAVAKCCWSGII